MCNNMQHSKYEREEEIGHCPCSMHYKVVVVCPCAHNPSRPIFRFF